AQAIQADNHKMRGLHCFLRDCVGGGAPLNWRPFPSCPVMALHRFDPEARHEPMFDIGRAFRRTPNRAFCVNNSHDNPGDRLPQSTREDPLKVLLGFDHLDLIKTGALGYLRQVSTKGGMRWLRTGEFELAVIPDDVNEILWRPRCRGGQRIQVHENSAIAIENNHLLLWTHHG